MAEYGPQCENTKDAGSSGGIARRVRKINRGKKVVKDELSLVKEEPKVGQIAIGGGGGFHKRIPSANIPYSMVSTHTNITRLNGSKSISSAASVGIKKSSNNSSSVASSSGGQRKESLRNPSIYRN